MTQTPAGWYADPDPTSAGTGRLRYWDGQQWTEQLHETAPTLPAETPALPTYPTYPGTPDPQPYAVGTPPIQYGQYPPYPTAQAVATTPDGQRLAGWWLRVAAQVLDTFIALPLFVLASIPVVSAQWDNLSQWFDDLGYAVDNNLPDPPDPALLDPQQGAFWMLAGSILVASLLYQFTFLLWKQATPGKLIVGLRVRLRDRPELPAGTIVIRLLSLVLLGLCWIVQLLDYLWPLWDDKKQALHDKMAKTNVVRVR